jgi:4-diphosphocytidyl-2-C-methyl-D-erythritol kinase
MGFEVISRDWPAPAKLNLFLHVTGRRADGFHELQTVFQFLDWGDSLDFTITDDGHVRRENDVAEVEESRDLAVRAAIALQRQADVPHGVRIHLRKQVPLGAGLGGGSSDAATTLVALNHLWGINLPRERLIAMGARLGADVPVFVGGGAAWAEGIGERLTPVEPPESWYVVVTPPVHISTAQVFADPQLTRNSRPITIRDFREGRARNDLEPVVCRRYPVVAEALNWLAERLGAARMTGSGASVFAPVENQGDGQRLLARLPGEWTGLVLRGVNRSPLLDRLEEAR